MELSPYVVGEWVGSAPEDSETVARRAAAELLDCAAEHLVLDLGRLRQVSDPVVRTLSASVNQALRVGRNVCLVRCEDALFARLRAAGMAGAVRHAGSLPAATGGLAGDPASILDLYVRSSPELLRRLRNVVSAIAREARLSDDLETELKTAVTEAAANAILHGSPEGSRNHIRVSFHLEPEILIIDVADQGRGFDPEKVRPPVAAELREHGYGIHLIRQAMDRVEFFRDESGMLVRMTRYLGPP
jgi:anti-sigma regulatory factor (Ser/Thr protein kinase)